MENTNQIQTISIIGSGNVATAIGSILLSKGLTIREVYSRTENSAKLLSKKLGCSWVNNLKELNTDSHLYLLAISDDQLPVIGSKLAHLKGIVVHTSGSQSINVLESNKENAGIFYPLQTMTMDKVPDFTNIPICVEANKRDVAEKIRNLAEKISSKVVYLDSEQRQYLHLTAVTVNNFTNLLYNHAHEVLGDKEIDFSFPSSPKPFQIPLP